MNIVQKYGKAIENKVPTDPSAAFKDIMLGLSLEQFKLDRFPDRKVPKAYRHMKANATRALRETLKHPESCVWSNIFAPVEIFQSFDLSGMSMEAISSYLSGFYTEDYFMDKAEQAGIANTLCSYHRCFIGAAQTGLLPRPVLSCTTSTMCDGNLSTFRYLKEKNIIDDFTLLDIPYQETEETLTMVEQQLWTLIHECEKVTGKSFEEAKLKSILEKENESHRLYQSFLKKRMTHQFPNTPGLVLFLLMATHLYIGSDWVLQFFQEADQEIEEYPFVDPNEKHLLWLHIAPYSEPSLQRLLGVNSNASITADDFNMDFLEPLDVEHPVRALAHKLICNIYNGPVDRKIDACVQYAKEYQCDGVVQFCHWGCKQSIGSSLLMKEAMKKESIPMLMLESDALDRRNMQDGQIATRLEAFIELLEKGERTK